jgi:hypothetical protein
LPKIIFRIEDFPAPEGPDSTTHSPGRPERNAAHHGKLHAALQMHSKGLFGVADIDHRCH